VVIETAENCLNGISDMNIGADMRVDTPSLPRQAHRGPLLAAQQHGAGPSDSLRSPLDQAQKQQFETQHTFTEAPEQLIDLSTAPVTGGIGFPAKEVSPMYSPVSIAFFGLTGTAVGAAGLSGSFGGLTSLVITAAVLAVLFASVLAARVIARRRFGRAISR
jgi:hypothetical protein